jgi:hypothetical protein
MADGQPLDDELAPTALTDLSVVWGRSNNLDQPSPATCTFEVMDLAGGQTFAQVLHMGARVDVRTDATIYPDPTLELLTDGGFEQGTQTWRATNGVATVGTGTVHAGAKALKISPVDGTRLVTIDLPPAAFSANPSAWDSIPRAKLGQLWAYSAWVNLASQLGVTNQAVTIKPIAYFNPDGSNPAVVAGDAPQLGPGGPAGWSKGAGTVLPPADAWMGLRVEIYPSGPSWDELSPSISWGSLGATPVWADLSLVWIDDLSLLAPSGGVARAALVFSGRITDLDARYDLSVGGTVVQVIAADNAAELANRYLGDQPWTESTLADRFSAIVAGSGQAITYTVAPSVGSQMVSYRDVDAQPALRLLQELSASVAGVLWSATSLVTGPVLHLDDVGTRVPLKQLMMVGSYVEIVIKDPVPAGGIKVSACNLLLEPVRWHQASDDDSTEVSVVWLEQLTDPGPPVTQKPTQRTVTALDAPAEVATGKRRIGITSQLSTQAGAQLTANAVLGRSRTPGWRISGLKWHLNPYELLSPDDLDVIMRILDGTTRMGLAIVIDELPQWSPISAGTDSVAVYLEGGRFTNSDGYWAIDLLVSDAASQGQAAIPWQDLAADWSWDEFGFDVDWSDLSGVGI